MNDSQNPFSQIIYNECYKSYIQAFLKLMDNDDILSVKSKLYNIYICSE